MNRLLSITQTRWTLCAAAAAVLFTAPIASAKEPGDRSVRLCADPNYSTDGKRDFGLLLTLEPGQKQMQFMLSSNKNKPLSAWVNRISSIQLGKKVGVVVQTDDQWRVFTKSVSRLDKTFDDRIYNVILFQKIGRSHPDGASFSRHPPGTVLGSGLGAGFHNWFVPAHTSARKQYNQWPLLLLKTGNMKWMQIHGPDTVVEFSYGNPHWPGNTPKRFKRKPGVAAINLDKELNFDWLASSQWLAVLRPQFRYPSLSSPGVLVPSSPQVKTGDLSGRWHSNLGDVHFTHKGNSLNGDVTFPGNAKGLIFGNVSKETVTFNWIINPLLFGNGQLKVAADRKSMTGWYREFNTTAKQNWKLWR